MDCITESKMHLLMLFHTTVHAILTNIWVVNAFYVLKVSQYYLSDKPTSKCEQHLMELPFLYSVLNNLTMKCDCMMVNMLPTVNRKAAHLVLDTESISLF